MKRISLVIALALVGAVLFGCATTSTSSSSRPSRTRQNLANASGIRAGMAQGDVLRIMKAAPVKKEIFSPTREEWHYCATGTGSDQFVAIMFDNDQNGVPRVSSLKNYAVTLDDVGGATGDCSRFVKRGTYYGAAGAAAPSAAYRTPKQERPPPATTLRTYATGGATALLLYADNRDRTFLGCLNCNEYDSGSVFNQYGEYGSQYSDTSTRNQYSEYGSRYSDVSACNPNASRPPFIFDEDGGYYGRFTMNRYADGAADSDYIRRLVALLCQH
jgi:hypothetical protein